MRFRNHPFLFWCDLVEGNYCISLNTFCKGGQMQVKSKHAVHLQKPYKVPFKWLLQADSALRLHSHVEPDCKSNLKGTIGSSVGTKGIAEMTCIYFSQRIDGCTSPAVRLKWIQASQTSNNFMEGCKMGMGMNWQFVNHELAWFITNLGFWQGHIPNFYRLRILVEFVLPSKQEQEVICGQFCLVSNKKFHRL